MSGRDQLKHKMLKGEPLRFSLKGLKARVTLVAPKRPPADITLKKTGRGYRVDYSETSEEGLYVFTIHNGKKTSKQWFAVGNVVIDWIPVSFVTSKGESYVERTIKSFSDIGNIVVAHNLYTWEGAEYPSRRFSRVKGLETDPIAAILRISADHGVAVLLAYHWAAKTGVDMWMHPGAKQTASAKAMVKELHRMYASFPSMAGFYFYWEPGDILEAPYYDQTTRYVKSLDPGLFTGAAPYIFSTERYHGGTLPLMPSALSAVEALDCIIPQSSIAIYPYPITRTKDHLALAAASLAGHPSRLAVGHVETFPRYFVDGEKLMPSDVVAGQILSASMTRDASGVSAFIFSYVADRGGDAPQKFREAMAWFRRSAELRRTDNPVAAYFPLDPVYWPTMGTKVLAGLRRIGLDARLIQPPLGDLKDWANRVRDRADVILLFDPPELRKCEARALADLCRSGSSLVVFGYPPSGLREVLGVDSRNVGKYGGYKLTEPLGRRTVAEEVKRFGFEFVFCPTLRGAEPLAVFESIPPGFQPGAFAVTRNRFGKGRACFVGVPSLVVLERTPELLLDLVDQGLAAKRGAIPWDIDGLSEECDMIVSSDSLAVVNLGRTSLSAVAHYRGAVKPRRVEVSDDESGVEWNAETLDAQLLLRPMQPVLVKLVR